MTEQDKQVYPGESLVAAEIARQPWLWPTTLERVLKADRPLPGRGEQVVFTGAGTSAYAALAVADAWPGARGLPSTSLLLQSAAEIAAAVPAFTQGGWLISLARSGDSPESVGVVQRVQRLFPLVKHLAIVCHAEGRLANSPGVEAIVLDPRTNDRSLAMTASFSNLVLSGYCLLHSRQVGDALPAICAMVVSLLPEWNAAATEIARQCEDRIIFLASSMPALVLEAGIKVVEMTAGRITPMGESFLGLRHGPLTFARPDTPIVCLASSDKCKRSYEIDLLHDLRDRGLGKIALVGDPEASSWPHDWFIKACSASLPDHLRTAFEVVFLQLLAYQLSLRAGVDPDDPSPGGVVTRVVRPFQIHDEFCDA